MAHCCLHWCANCQEHRERRGRLAADNSAMPMTVVNPPPVQEMSVLEHSSAPAPAAPAPEENGASHKAELRAHNGDNDDVEVIPL
jgi:hypothetical protein